MAELVAVIDTGVLCCLLQVPGKETAGSGQNHWNGARAQSEIDSVTSRKGTLILPLSVIIETANHIAQATHSRRQKADVLFDRVTVSLAGTYPWRRFDESQLLWNEDWYREAKANWPGYAERGMGLADYSLASISRFFHRLGSEVRTLTTDQALFREIGHLMPDTVAKRRSRR